MKNKLTRFFSLVIVLVMLLPILPTAAFAEEVISGCVDVTGGNYNGGIYTVTASGWWSSQTKTVTITNTSSSKAKITFSYDATGNINSFSESPNSGTKELTLDAGATYTITISNTKKTASTTTATLKLSNFTYKVVVDGATAKVTYNTYGSVKTGGVAVANGGTSGTIGESGVEIVATPASGASFVAWVDNDTKEVISFDATYKLLPYATTMNLWAIFTKPDQAPYYMVGNTVYTDFTSANTAAANGSDKVIVVISDGTLSNGTYNIDSGTTLLVPYSPGNTKIESTTSTIDGSQNSTFEYANKELKSGATHGNDAVKNILLPNEDVTYTLTISSDATVNVTSGGKFIIGGIIAAGHESTIGVCSGTAGAHSNIQLKGTLNVSGILSCCGYILGSGTVNVTETGTIYQPFILMDHRSGQYAVVSNNDKIFPFNRYAMLNIQSDIHMVTGAQMKGYVTIYTSRIDKIITIPERHNVSTIGIIGSSDSLIELGNGTLDISYNPNRYANDAIHEATGLYSRVGTTTLDFDGEAFLGAFSLTINVTGSNYDLSSANDYLPVPYNYIINLNKGTFYIAKDMKLMPGARMTVASDATLNVNKGFAIMTGFRDHSTVAATADENTWPNYHYPSSGVIQAAPLNGSGAADFFINGGTVNVANTGTLVGIAQTNGSGTIVMNGTNTLKLKIGDENATKIMGLMDTTICGRTVYEMKAELFMNGKRIDLESGKTYYGVDSGTNTIPSYSYSLYSQYNDNSKIDNKTVNNFNAKVVGSWCTAQGHNPDAGVVKDPTCTEQGYTTYTCQEPACGYRYKDHYVDALGHSYDAGKITTAPKCEATGVKTYTCTVCGGTKTEEVAATDHSWSITGYTTHDNDSCIANYTCKNDSSHTKSDNPAAHDYDANFYCPNCQYTKKFTITFNTNGGSAIKAITQAYNSKVAAPANPTKEGHTFAGWDKKIPETMPGYDQTITAQWTINQYTITFNTGCDAVVAPITQNYNSAVTMPAGPARAGYTFKGWDKTYTTIPAGNVTVDAQWEPIQYTITFDSNGGTAVASITQGFETQITKPVNPTKTGYTFKGWSPALPATMPLNGGTYTATWAINQYTITFDTQGGSEISAITQDYNTAVTAPKKPTKTGYTFTKWDKTIPTVMPPENMTITAVWAANSYQIKWETDSGNFATTNAKYGSTIALPGAPSKTGYTFDGWWTEKTGGNRITDTTVYVTDGPSTYYAHWKINQYTISFLDTDGSVLHTIKQDYGTSVTVPNDPTKTGYTFTGWSAEIPTTMPDMDVTIKAKWTINQYTITFNTDGGPEIAPITQNYGTAIPTITDPVKSGYTFSGWSQEIPATMPAENITIKATWNVNTYEVTWSEDGDTSTKTQQTYGTNLVLPEVPSKTGYTFLGWFTSETGGEQVTGNDIFTNTNNDTVYYAQWEVNKYTITWCVDEDIVETDEGVAYGESPEFNGTVDRTVGCTEYKLAGWATSVDEFVLNPMPNVTEDAVYYAVFTEEIKHTSADSDEWKSDVSGHWHVCTQCHGQDKFAPHVSSGEADSTNPETCTICGYVINPATGTGEFFSLYGSSVVVADGLDIYFYIDCANLDGEDYRAEITRVRNGVSEAAPSIPYTEWEKINMQGIEYMRFCYDGIAAKEMTDMVHVTIYKGNELVSNQCSESVQGYVMRTLKYYSGEQYNALKTTLVDMLNYGSAAQDFFGGYNSGNLADKDLTEEQKMLATSDRLYIDTSSGSGFSGSVSAKNKLIFTFYFSDISNVDHATVTYKNKSIPVTTFREKTQNGNKLYGVDVTGIAIADGTETITCTLTYNNGTPEKTVSCNVESYVSTAYSKGVTDHPVFKMLMHFIDSAHAYFR